MYPRTTKKPPTENVLWKLYLVPIANHDETISPLSIPIPKGAKRRKGWQIAAARNLADVPTSHLKFAHFLSHDMVTIFYDEIEFDAMKKTNNQLKMSRQIHFVKNDGKVAIRLEQLLGLIINICRQLS